MSKPKVFVTRAIPEKGLALVREFCEAQVWPGEMPPSRAELLRQVRGAEGLLSLLTERMDAEVFAAAGSQLKVVSNMAVGYDNIDVPAATARGIPVGNTPGVLTDATADLAFTLLLSAGRRVLESDRYIRTGQWRTWSPMALLGADLNDASLGLVGFGRIGQAVARRAQGFGMRVIYYTPGPAKENTGINAERVDLDTLLREADFISLHTPLTPATHHLIDASALAKMKPNAVLINTARGAVVDTDTLYEALRQKQIFAAGLDVPDPEPLPADHPLLTLENVTILPHIGSASYLTRDRMAQMAAENLIAGLKGERLPNCVNPEVYA